jgi:hypothetical protein
MSMILWYIYKADQCARMADEANHPRERSQFLTERQLWLEIAEAEHNRESILLESSLDTTAATPEETGVREILSPSAKSSGTEGRKARRRRQARRHESRLH